MTDSEIKRIVDNIIRNDDTPPSAEYSTYDYGISVASSFAPEGAAQLVAECLKALPSSLAATFLEGVLDRIEVPQLENVLLRALCQSREVSSASPIVDWLISRCGLKPRAIAINMIHAIRKLPDVHAQNTHAYALWIVTGAKNDQSADREVGEFASAQDIKDMIDQTLQEPALTQYARDILNTSKVKWVD